MRRKLFPVLRKARRRPEPEAPATRAAVVATSRLVPSLLRWYGRHARDLPWRRTQDPYAIWIAEVMLQQTRVETVRPYWERWMQRFPTIQTLARARSQTVLKLWEGLGYYQRARAIHATAQRIVNEFAGQFPHQIDILLQLPGIGPYTAGAICSIAFNQPTPILDGNVIRVLARLHGIEVDPRQSAVRAKLWALADALVREAARNQSAKDRDCAALNQALMELGAMVCTPRAPRCGECPWISLCVAHRSGAVDRIPALPRRPEPIERHVTVLALRNGDRFLVRRQPQGSMNAGLWEFPAAIGNAEETGWPEVLSAEHQLQIPAASVPWLRLVHSITRYRIRMTVHLVRARVGPRKDCVNERWCTARQLDRLAMSAAHRKIVNRLRNA
jgi:A/G-specific adenine glycosylase